jgi:small subunit ribosomal protein S3Ae
MSSKANKLWVSINAPAVFNQIPLPKIMTSSPESIINRRITVSLSDITGDIRQVQVFLKFRITNVEGNTARTRFDQLELAREYVRGMVRKGITKTEAILEAETKDGALVRIFVVTINRGKLHRSKRTAIRKAVENVFVTKANESLFNDFVQYIVMGRAGADIASEVRKIASVNTLEIRKVKVLRPPSAEAQSQEAV